MKSILTTPVAAGLLSALMIGAPAAAAEAEVQSAEHMVRQTADELLGIVRDAALDPQSKRARIEETLYARADFDTVTKLVLARNWARFSPEQQREFKESFRKYLSTTYGRNIDDYTHGRKDPGAVAFEILGSKPEAKGDVTVRTRISSPDLAPVIVEYRMRQTDGAWRIIDVIGEGISLISNMRSQFQEIVSQGGPERLLKLLREKNASSAATSPSGQTS